MQSKRERREVVRDKRKQKKNKIIKFNATEYVNKLFAKDRYSSDKSTQMSLYVARKIAQLVAKAAVNLEIDDHDTVAKLIVLFAMNHRYIDYSIQRINEEFLSSYGNYYIYATDGFYRLLQASNVEKIVKIVNDNMWDSGILAHILKVIDVFRAVSTTGQAVDPVIMQDCLAITAFLVNKPLVESYFDALESRLQNHVNQSGDYLRRQLSRRQDGIYTIPVSALFIFRSHKILSTVLKDWSQKNGFSAYVYVIGRLSDEQMSGILQSHGFFKDVYTRVGDYHGAWSHALQWYLIFEHQRATKFLISEPMAIYENFVSSWQLVIDTYNGEAYYSPEYMTNKMLEPASAERWPILSGTIARHHAKMHSPYFSYLEKFDRQGIHDTVYVRQKYN